MLVMDFKSKTDLLQYSDAEVSKVFAKSNITVEKAAEDVGIIRNWMTQQKHLPFVFGDRLIFSFLKANHFCLEEAKTCIDMYFTLKGLFPEFFSHSPNHSKLKAFQSYYNLFALPKLDEKQRRVLVSQVTDPNYFDKDIFFCLLCQIVDLLYAQDVSTGMEIILDFTLASKEMFEKLTTDTIMKYVFIIEKTFSNLFSTLHVIKSSESEDFMEMFLEKSKPILHDKIISHKNYQTLMNHFSKDVLPKDFGGDLKSLKEFNADWQRYLQDQSVHLEKHMKARTNERLRTFEINNEEVLEFKENIEKLYLN